MERITIIFQRDPEIQDFSGFRVKLPEFFVRLDERKLREIRWTYKAPAEVYYAQFACKNQLRDLLAKIEANLVNFVYREEMEEYQEPGEIPKGTKVYIDGHKKIVIERFEESKINSIFPKYLALPKQLFPQVENFELDRVRYELEFLRRGNYRQIPSEYVELQESKEDPNVWLFPLAKVVAEAIWRYRYSRYTEDWGEVSDLTRADKLRLKITEVIYRPVKFREIKAEFPVTPIGRVKLSA